MSLLNSQKQVVGNSRLARLSLLVALGLILFMFESFIPRPLPWLKPGLAHVATLLAMYLLGNRSAIMVVVLRVFIGSLLLGTLLNPAFILALGGSLSATLVMGLVRHYLSRVFSIFGISIIGALVHNLTQLFLVQMILVRRTEIYYLAPFMMLTSLVTGFIVALVAWLLLSRTAPSITGS
ncbi:MAG: Gx transporter family protein [candidate division KSB1 bacterium]|nr:Gx transporter family protein [candidate division KSB1 bacterium]